MKKSEAPNKCQSCEEFDTCGMAKEEVNSLDALAMYQLETIKETIKSMPEKDMEALFERLHIIKAKLIQNSPTISLSLIVDKHETLTFIDTIFFVGYMIGKGIGLEHFPKSSDVPEFVKVTTVKEEAHEQDVN
jgi:hypothetical protein